MSLNFENHLQSLEFTTYLFQNLPSAIFIADEKLNIKSINNSFKSLLKKEEFEILDQMCGDALGCCFSVEENRPCGTTSQCKECPLRKCIVKAFVENGRVLYTIITRKFYIANETIVKKLRFKIKHFKYNDEGMVVVEISDCTEQEEEKKQLREIVTRDLLTNLYNRRYFFEVGEKIFQNVKRNNTNIAIVMINIDF